MAQVKGSFDSGRVVAFSDFLGDPGQTPFGDELWTIQDTSAAGTPTIDYVNNDPDGVFGFTHDATSEAQSIGLNWGDNLCCPAGQGWVMEARVKIQIATGAVFSADQRFVCGMAGARDATLDDTLDLCWFRVEGAAPVWMIEGDDGITDTDDQVAQGVAFTDDTFQTLTIDGRDLAAVRFAIDGLHVGTVNVAAMADTDGLQFFAELQRDAGTELDGFEVDWVRVYWDRS